MAKSLAGLKSGVLTSDAFTIGNLGYGSYYPGATTTKVWTTLPDASYLHGTMGKAYYGAAYDPTLAMTGKYSYLSNVGTMGHMGNMGGIGTKTYMAGSMHDFSHFSTSGYGHGWNTLHPSTIQPYHNGGFHNNGYYGNGSYYPMQNGAMQGKAYYKQYRCQDDVEGALDIEGAVDSLTLTDSVIDVSASGSQKSLEDAAVEPAATQSLV
jgi:hypothetical protein